MGDQPVGKKVVTHRLLAVQAQRRVRELAQDTSNIVWTNHISERMEARGIDADAVLRILRDGDCEEPPVEAEVVGDWKLKMVRKLATGRFAGVALALTQDDRLVLITAEWEDRR
jgi:hypothetical protein